MEPNDLFRAASVTKPFVATTVVMLQDEGLLSLDDPVADYVNGVPDGDQITIRQALSHRSGLYNYSDNIPDWAADYTPAELVGIAAAHSPYFAPGDGYHYSNTNYIVADPPRRAPLVATRQATSRGRAR